MLEIDGSAGEGGGQVLRTSIALSIATNTPVRIYNIRKKRPNPGLQPQHYMAIKAASYISKAEVTGLEISSQEVYFKPNQFSKDISTLDVGTAGSIPLILQTLIPSLAVAHLSFPLEVIGGTDVKWSPTIDYMRYVFAPFLASIGIKLDIEVKRRGYYPKGGGKIVFQVENVSFPAELRLEKGNRQVFIRSICSNLPEMVATRQANAALRIIEKAKAELDVRVISSKEAAISSGTSIVIYTAEAFRSCVGSDSIGEKGKPAEKVGEEAAKHFMSELSSSPDVDSHLGDMIVPYLFLSPYHSRVKISRATSHLKTNLLISSLFIKRAYSIIQLDDGSAILEIS
ncbi:MAG: RNA 3'-terminal phosphate cyclase [Nitrososphaeria archaeon]